MRATPGFVTEAFRTTDMEAPMIGGRRRERTWITLLAASVAVVLLAGALINGASLLLGNRHVGGEPTPAATGSFDRATASALLGIPPMDVILTEDGALGVVSRDERISLVLLRMRNDGAIEALTLGSIPLGDPPEVRLNGNGAGRDIAASGTIACPADLGRPVPGTSSARSCSPGRWSSRQIMWLSCLDRTPTPPLSRPRLSRN